MIVIKIVDELTISPLIRKCEKVWDAQTFLLSVFLHAGSCGAVILHDHLQTLPPLVHIDIRIVYDVDPDAFCTSSLIELSLIHI